jgi:hypothetical protein
MKQTANYAKEVPVFGGKRQLQQLVLPKDQVFPKDTASAKDPRDFQMKARTAPSRNSLYTIGNSSAHCNGRKNTCFSSGYRITPDPSDRAFRLRRTSTADSI